MKEERIVLRSGGLNLEGALCNAPGDRGVVVSHPHPLYGGNMDNDVVVTTARAYAEHGWSALRFNFRGVGQSEGEYDQGRREQEDVGAAVRALGELGKTAIDLAGYSFGAWVNALGLNSYDRVDRAIMISPPVGMMDFGFLETNRKIALVVVGACDEFAPLDLVQELVPRWNPSAVLRVVKGANHFYMTNIQELQSIIEESI